MFLPGRVGIRLLTIGALSGALLGGACTGGTQDHARVEVRSADCIVCHVEDVQHALNPPHVGFPDTCGTCHSNDAWIPAAFMHIWPLNGAHAMADCASCHLGDPPVYQGTPTQCVGCHQADYDNSPFPGHDAFPTTCQDCHTTNGWTPAVGGTHPENAFPIQDGPHSKYRTDCVSCHDPELGSSVGGENADCVGCHDGEHTRAEMDPKHDEEPDYPQGAAPPNFCLDCHPDGRD
jgi:hypothetical protein